MGTTTENNEGHVTQNDLFLICTVGPCEEKQTPNLTWNQNDIKRIAVLVRRCFPPPSPTQSIIDSSTSEVLVRQIERQMAGWNTDLSSWVYRGVGMLVL
jgi:hypothetical protein